MSLSCLLVSVSAAGECAANDSTAYLHHLQEVVNKPQFEAYPCAYLDEWYPLAVHGGWSFIACLVSVVLVVLAIKSLNKISSQRRDLILKWGFVVVWMFGFIVYDIGTCTGEKLSFFTNIPMSILHSLGMFLLESDVSAIHHDYHGSWIYMMLFSLAHILAAAVSTLFVIKHFGYHIWAGYKMLLESVKLPKSIKLPESVKRHLSKSKDKTYVFWGLNETSFRLIEDIKAHHAKEKDENYRIIVVRSNKSDDDSVQSKTGLFRRVFSFLALRNSELERLQELDCLSTSTYVDSMKINPDHKCKKTVDIIGEKLNLRSLRRILENYTGSEIHMLFLSDKERENLHDVALLLGDKTIKTFAGVTGDTQSNSEVKDSNGSRKVVKFYCHARYNSVHRVIEDMAVGESITENITVNVIDSSHYNVELLKTNEKVLPVNFVDVNDDATVSSPFNALVVGFSEVGLDSARFLYEFGAFVKEGSSENRVERSDFRLDVVDKKMSVLAGTFVANAPAVKPSLPFIEGMENDDAPITLHEMDCCSAEFYLKMQEWIKRLNYIVVATDDDELNISTAVRIFRLATRYRDNLDKLCILVRAHNDEDGHIRKIAMHYNRLWAAQKAATNNSLNQTEFKREDEAALPIFLFGLDKDVYTYDVIIDDSLEQKAIGYKETYEASTNPKYVKGKETAWESEFKKLMQLTEVKINGQMVDLRPYYPTYGGLMRLRRTQGQDFANCLHQLTKELLAEKALKGLGLESFEWKDLSRKMNTTTYYSKSGKEVDQRIVRILDVLAWTEHLRWNASHELLGYQHTDIIDQECNVEKESIENDICKFAGDKKCGECRFNLGYKDEVRLLHNCIRDWQNLDTEKRSYDCNVVDITLGIITEDNPIEEEPEDNSVADTTTPQQ